MNPKQTVILLTAMIMALTGFDSYSAATRGIRSVLLPVDNSPLVTFRIQFGVGSAHDPDGKKGLTELTASLLTGGGTAKREYTEIIDAFYPMATSVSSQVDKEVTTIVGTVHKDHLKKYYDMLIEMVLEPGFREEDFERIRTDRVNRLERQLRFNDDENLGKESLNVFLYQDHPYGCPVSGLVTNLKAIGLDDVRDHYRRFFTRDNVVIGLAGGYPGKLERSIRDDLSKLPQGRVEEVTLPEPGAIHGLQIMVVEKECRSTAISMGFPIDVVRGEEDFYPLMIANSYLGEHRTFNGVLMNRMRGDRGLNYGDYSYIENFVQEGGSTFPLTNIPRRQQHFSIWVRPVVHKNRHFALRLALWELNKLVTQGMNEEDFSATRKFLSSYSRLWAQDQSRRLGYLLDSKFYGVDDFLGTLPAKLESVTLEDVNRVIRKYLATNNMKVAIVTRGADEFLKEILDNKPSPIVYDAEDMPEDLLAEDKKIEVFKLAVNRDESRVVHAKDLFE